MALALVGHEGVERPVPYDVAAEESVLGSLLLDRDAEPANNHMKGDRPLTAADFAICPDCGGIMRRIATVTRSCNPEPFSCDTS
mgnify:CR=1 FL=1